MAKVTRLNVMITASTKGLSLGINKAQGLLKSLTREAKDMKRYMGGVFTSMGNIATRGFTAFGVAATGAAAGLAYLTKQSIDAVGDTNDFAKALGLTYNELRAIQFAAGQAGVDAGALNAAFAKMSDTLGTAFGGNDAAVKAFEGIGLSIADLEKMSPAQQFEAIANAINKIEDPSKRIAAARDIFGKSGGALISLFENAGQAIREAANTLGFFGINLSQLDVTKIDNAGDAMGTLSLMLEGVGNQLARVVSPYIQQVTQDTIDWVERMGGVGPAVDMAFGAIVDTIDSMLTKIENIELAWMKATKAVNDFYLTLYAHDPNSDLEQKRTKAMTDRRLQGIPEDRREQAQALLDKQGGFVSESPHAAAFNEKQRLDAEYEKRKAEIENRKAERGTLGQRFSNWRAGAEYNANVAVGAVPVMQQTPGARAPRDREDPALQVLRNIEANTGKNKIAFAG